MPGFDQQQHVKNKSINFSFPSECSKADSVAEERQPDRPLLAPPKQNSIFSCGIKDGVEVASDDPHHLFSHSSFVI